MMLFVGKKSFEDAIKEFEFKVEQFIVFLEDPCFGHQGGQENYLLISSFFWEVSYYTYATFKNGRSYATMMIVDASRVVIFFALKSVVVSIVELAEFKALYQAREVAISKSWLKVDQWRDAQSVVNQVFDARKPAIWATRFDVQISRELKC